MTGFRIALDTNLIAYETPRRIIVGAIAEVGGTVVILPTVRASAIRRLRREEAQHWDQVTEDAGLDLARSFRITAACEAAVEAWFEEEVHSHNGPYEVVEQDWLGQQQARRIGRNLPPGAVKVGRRGEDEDRDIVGEAIMQDVTLLTTNNLDSICHETINDWLVEILKARTTPLLSDPDGCMKQMRDEHHLDLYDTTLRYLLRTTETTEDDWRAEYLKGLERLKGCGLDWLAEAARWRYESDPRFAQRINHAMRSSGGGHVQAAERRKHHARHIAARDAGFDR